MLLQSACVTSLQPVVSYDKAIVDEKLPGAWKNKDQEFTVQKFFNSDFYQRYKGTIDSEKVKNNVSVEKPKRDSILFSKSYIIEYMKEGVQYEMFGSLIRLNGRLFINFFPIEAFNTNKSGEETEINIGKHLDTYTIARLEFKNANSIQLDFIDGDFIYKEVKAGRLKIKHERNDLYDTFLITASTSELQQFLEKYGGDNRLFNKENSTTLTRKT
jgi:hypothetical protein